MSEKRILRECQKNCKASSHSNTLKMRLKKLYRKLKKAFKNGATQIKRKLNDACTHILAKAFQIIPFPQRQLKALILIAITFKIIPPSLLQQLLPIIVKLSKVLFLAIVVGKIEPTLTKLFHFSDNSIVKELILLTLLQHLEILE